MFLETQKYNDFGSLSDILSFYSNFFESKSFSITDLSYISSIYTGKRLDTDALLAFSLDFKVLQIDSNYSIRLDPLLFNNHTSNDSFIHNLVNRIIITLFNKKIFSSSLFSFDRNTKRFTFDNSIFSLDYSSFRNILISLGFFIPNKDSDRKYIFSINPNYESIILSALKNNNHSMTLNDLLRKIENDRFNGELAEKFVLEWEKKRISIPKSHDIKIISEINVSAGYDIVSFDYDTSFEYDRFIEIKSIGNESSFYWSKNEIETSRILNNKYYLYLVNINNIYDPNYNPQIICNPYKYVFNSNDWQKSVEKYNFKKK